MSSTKLAALLRPLAKAGGENYCKDPETGHFCGSGDGGSGGGKAKVRASGKSTKAYASVTKGDLFKDDFWNDLNKSQGWYDKEADKNPYSKGADKAHVANTLSSQLQNNKAWQEAKSAMERHGFKPLHGSMESTVVHTWARTSGDNDKLSVALQAAAREEFGLRTATHDHFMSDDKLKQAWGSDYPKIVKGLRAFSRQVYENTQKELASKGIKEVAVVRGFAINEHHLKSDRAVVAQDRPVLSVSKMKWSPLSSFTVSEYTATEFLTSGSQKKGEYMALAFERVAAKDVFSYFRTGPGCKDEGEVVVLGHTRKTAVLTMKNKPMAFSHAKELFHKKKVSSKEKPTKVDLTALLTKAEEEDEDLPELSVTLSPDENLDNADWLKTTWDMPPYKSPEFMDLLRPRTLAQFRTLPVYKHAVRKGLIKNDKWVGEEKKASKLFGGYGLRPACPICALAKASKKRSPTGLAGTGLRAYVTTNEAATAAALAKVMRKYAAKFSKKVALMLGLTKASKKKPTVDSILKQLDVDGFATAVVDALTPDMVEAFKVAGVRAFQSVGMQEDMEAALSQLDEAALNWATERGAELVGRQLSDDGTELIENPDAKWSITETTRDALRSKISEAVESGWGAQDLAREIEDSFAFSEGRASMIARTELAFAHTSGNVEGWRESGVVVGKQAIMADTHPEIDVCDDNAEAGPIPLEENFPSGDYAPPFHPNCLCDLVPVLEGEM
jgi:hypothetical protein